MFPTRTITLAAAVLALASSLSAQPTQARAAIRAAQPAFAKTSLSWVQDARAADPCMSEPGCFNSVKYGYTVVPMTISSDTNVVFQVAARPKDESAVLNLDVYTQPGCGISACHVVKHLVFFTKEECFNGFVEKVATESDGATAKLHFGGVYYENLPAGELYAKFERKNYLTEQPTCTYEIRSGFKRWF